MMNNGIFRSNTGIWYWNDLVFAVLSDPAHNVSLRFWHIALCCHLIFFAQFSDLSRRNFSHFRHYLRLMDVDFSSRFSLCRRKRSCYLGLRSCVFLSRMVVIRTLLCGWDLLLQIGIVLFFFLHGILNPFVIFHKVFRVRFLLVHLTCEDYNIFPVCGFD